MPIFPQGSFMAFIKKRHGQSTKLGDTLSIVRLYWRKSIKKKVLIDFRNQTWSHQLPYLHGSTERAISGLHHRHENRLHSVPSSNQLHFWYHVLYLTFSSKPAFAALIVPQMCPHQALPEFAVIGHKEMQEFVDNDIVPEFLIEFQKFAVEIQMSVGGTGRPLVVHRAHPKPDDMYVQFISPRMDTALEGLLVTRRFQLLRFDLPAPVVRIVLRQGCWPDWGPPSRRRWRKSLSGANADC